MKATGATFLQQRLALLWKTVPKASRRRTAGGGLRTCRALGDHARRARQLYKYARTDEERRWIDELIEYCERRRDELSDGGLLAERVREERGRRREERNQEAEQIQDSVQAVCRRIRLSLSELG